MAAANAAVDAGFARAEPTNDAPRVRSSGGGGGGGEIVRAARRASARVVELGVRGDETLIRRLYTDYDRRRAAASGDRFRSIRRDRVTR